MIFGRVDPRQYAALRIGFGVLAFVTLWSTIDLAALHLSNDGWYTVDVARKLDPSGLWSVLTWIPSTAMVRLFIVASMAAALCMTIGWKSRFFTLMVFASVVSIQGRNCFVTYGGDAVLRVSLFYIGLSESGAAWSLDRWLRQRRERIEVRGNDRAGAEPRVGPDNALVPEWPLTLFRIQICIIYFSSGYAKLHGQDWFNGANALSIILMHPALAKMDFGFLRAGGVWPRLLQGATRIVLWWELAFPLLMLNRWSRRAALLLGLFMHLGIAFTLQVHWFSELMLVSYLGLLSNDVFGKAETIAMGWIRQLSRREGAPLTLLMRRRRRS
jgi:hypothetical protein